MFGMGWTELLVIGIVALIVVGPKDLPVLFRTLGQFVGKARGMAREFTRAMEEAADQSGVKEATDTLRGLSNPAKYGLDKVKDATDFTKWDPDSETGKLAKDRADNAEKIRQAAATKAQARLDAEAAAKAEAEAETAKGPAPLEKAMAKAKGDAPADTASAPKEAPETAPTDARTKT
ncbi:Sec-independent protein translocase protein TatB [Pseudooceanicola onchidii]|uniref:Sec-independent protein translocase protein TatB n=1 Tax=Pseudooceanicola onchidii TaxID=2562279 RepID=UPI0010AA65A4|nr:Sec-independent protein translocase protein TatB [Pseudooceanicola onchidii]